MTERSDLTGYTASFVTGLYDAGIKRIVISPGSRSTPLAMMFHAHPEIETWINVDERSAAFFALGMAKGLQEPVALLCSSGTAGANYFPAIIEARYARVPLVVLTADRPHELRGVGAPQTIDQIKLYGDHVKYHQEMPLPDENANLNAFVKASAGRAVGMAVKAPQGPVHLNFPFRDPLVPDVNRNQLWNDHSNGNPLFQTGKVSLNSQQFEKLAKTWTEIDKPLIVVGPHQDEDLAQAVITLARSLKAPIIADPLSGLRTGPFEKEVIIESYDTFLRSKVFFDNFKSNGVIRIGAMPVSKPFLKYLEAAKPEHYIVVDDSGVWREPTHLATQMIQSDAVSFCEGLAAAINKNNRTHITHWCKHWQEVNQKSKEIISSFIEESPWFEGHVVDILLKHVDNDSSLFVGNSMPIRDVDTLLLNRDDRLNIFANRGANGIDGVVSTAIGVSTVKKPLTLLIGDLSFFHDTNGLMAAKIYNIDITIIVINNNGGGIFSFLPQAKENEETFEALFGTPLDINVEAIAQVYNGKYRKATDKNTFEKALSDFKDQKGLKIIEAVTARKENVEIHNHLWQRVNKAVEVDFR
jgi:2-succinyl-5-enolpyruvyl-6-hydroxy-3-cyclohexene-1-carboxylate synthase